MAQEFHLKLITERAGGGDPIIRERRLAGPELSIGRAAESDIVLTDLDVDPRHAKMRFSGQGRVTIETVSGLPFQVNGKAVQRADLDVASKPVVTISTYSLAFEPAAEGGATVTVRHGEHAHYPTRSIFSLQSKVFGRRRMAWTFASAIFLICLIAPLLFAGILSKAKIHPDQQWSTGALSKAHAFLETDCKACHTKSFVAVRDDSCKACHQASHDPAVESKVLAVSKDKGSPFSALLVYDHADPKKLSKAAPLPDGFGAKVSTIVQRTLGHPTDRCASCHIEHTKPNGKTKTDANAPLSDKPDMVVVQDCQSCHDKLKQRLGKTDLIDTPNWGKHPAFRPLIMTSSEGATATFQRAALTSGPQENNGLKFPHRVHLDPLGGVARQAIDLGAGRGYGAPLECASCHRRDKAGTGFQPIQMEKDCGACHSLAYGRSGGQLLLYPHGEVEKTMALAGGGGGMMGSDRMRPGSIMASRFGSIAAPSAISTSPFRQGGACFDCHAITWTSTGMPHVTPVKLASSYMPRGAFDHAVPEHGGPGPSKQGGYKCADCHKAATSDRTADVLIPDIGKCNACHGQPKTKTAAASDGECATCHSFHAPGRSSPKPGHPPLETLRWTSMTAGKQAGD